MSARPAHSYLNLPRYGALIRARKSAMLRVLCIMHGYFFALRFRSRINGVEVFLLFRDDRMSNASRTLRFQFLSQIGVFFSEYALLLRVLVLERSSPYRVPKRRIYSDSSLNRHIDDATLVKCPHRT